MYSGCQIPLVICTANVFSSLWLVFSFCPQQVLKIILIYSIISSFLLCFVYFVSGSPNPFILDGHEDITPSLILWFLCLCECASRIALYYMNTGLNHANLYERFSTSRYSQNTLASKVDFTVFTKEEFISTPHQIRSTPPVSYFYFLFLLNLDLTNASSARISPAFFSLWEAKITLFAS